MSKQQDQSTNSAVLEEQNIPWSQQVDEALQNTSETCCVSKFGVFLDSDVPKGLHLKCTNISNTSSEDVIQRSIFHISDSKAVIELSNKGVNHKASSRVYSEQSYFPHGSMAFKKTTWASVASQPVKCLSTVVANSHKKKKGPGMPPPPMVPGKHNFDITAWELSQSSTMNKEKVANKYQGAETMVDDNEKFKEQSLPSLECREANTFYNDYSILNNNEKKSIAQQNYQNDASKMHQEQYFSREKIQKWSDISTKEKTYFEQTSQVKENNEQPPYIVLNELKDKNNYNPLQLNLIDAMLTRFFVIKSYSEDDIHRSIKYEIWCSTDHGNKRLDDAFRERKMAGGNVMLFFSVNGSGHFCGMAQMMTEVDYNSTASVWAQDKWKGKFKVKWIYVKDVPNGHLRHIKLENNDNKSVTHSRDTQEIPHSKGMQVLKILHSYSHLTSIFDDFYHYEKKQEEEISKKPYENILPANQPASKLNTGPTNSATFKDGYIELNSTHRRCQPSTYSKHQQFEYTRTFHPDSRNQTSSNLQFSQKNNENNNVGHLTEKCYNNPVGSQLVRRINNKECELSKNPKTDSKMFRKKE